MDLADRMFLTNRDWDPCYLHDIVTQDWFDFRELWQSNICDKELIHAVEEHERYYHVVEDISLDDDT